MRSPALRLTMPTLGFSTPVTSFAVVDLPEPFGPIMRHDLAAPNGKVDAFHQPAPVAPHPGAGDIDKHFVAVQRIHEFGIRLLLGSSPCVIA